MSLLQELTSVQLCCILNTEFADTEGSLLGILMFCVAGLTRHFPSVLEEEAEVHRRPVVGAFFEGRLDFVASLLHFVIFVFLPDTNTVI